MYRQARRVRVRTHLWIALGLTWPAHAVAQSAPPAASPSSDAPSSAPSTDDGADLGEPKAGEPKADEPKAGEPKAGEPKAGEPKAGEPKAGEPEPPRKPKFIGIPYPIFNPQLDFAVGAIAMLTYPLDKRDKLSPPSATQLFGLISSNKSYFVLARQEIFWAADNNRASLATGVAHFNSDYYGSGDATSPDITFPLKTDSFFIQAKYLRRIWNRLYLGGKYQLMVTNSNLSAPDEAPDEIKSYFPIETDDRNSGLGALAEFDSRDTRFSATRGFYVPLDVTWFSEAFGGTTNYVQAKIAYNSYHDLHQKKLILALRAMMKTTTANTPYYLLPAVGNGPDLRGYASGRYRDYVFMATQAELRWYFWKGLGAVVFAGIGSTTGGFDELFKGTVLPSYGAGVRYMLHKDQRLVMRVDYGRGNEDGMIYFSISEAY